MKQSVFAAAFLVLLPSLLFGQEEGTDRSAATYVHHLGRWVQLTIESSLVLVDEDLRSSTWGEMKSRSWTYRFRGELGLLQRLSLDAAFIPAIGHRPHFLRTGAGWRFTVPGAKGTAHPYFGFVSTLSANYVSYGSTIQESRTVLFEALEIRVDRRQWKVGKYLTLDAGGGVLPWTRIRNKSDVLLRTPYLSVSAAVGIEVDQYLTILFVGEQYAPLRESDQMLLYSVASVTVRTLL